MFVVTPEISWHSKEPIFSCSFQANSSTYRLATAGADHTIKIWEVAYDGKKLKLAYLSNLDRHTKAVNITVFSPDGSMLASGGDDCTVCLWKLDADKHVPMETNQDETEEKESWGVVKMLRGHLEDVYDISWSQDSRHLITGSVDNTAIVWDTVTGNKIAVLSDSQQYIQGVAWDPLNQYMATLSTDRALRLYLVTSHKCKYTISKCVPQMNGIKCTKMFQDEGLSSFFRRLTFSPDGSLLLAPGGKVEFTDNKIVNVSWMFTRNSFPQPVLYLPGPDKPSVVIKFCPVVFQLCPEATDDPVLDLPYRMVYAIATMDSVILYDTQHILPIAYLSQLHYASITDIAWSHDGHMLMISSTDGYCSFVKFEDQELGIPSTLDKLKHNVAMPLSRSATPSDNKECKKPRRIKPVPICDVVTTPPKPTRRITPTPIPDAPLHTATPTMAAPTPDTPTVNVPTPEEKKPRRVQLITLT